jgi:hypothetical protein
MGGLMSVTGMPGDGPMRVGIPIADLCAGIFAAQGILVALLERETSGKGQWLHTSLLESMVYMMDFQTSRYLIDGEVATQAGNFHPTSIPTGVYKARDGYMNIAVFGSKIWERFCNILGAPEWITDERYHDKASRSVNRDTLNAEINRRLAAQDRAYWVKQFNEGGVACGLINDMRGVFEEPQVQHLGMVKDVVSRWQGPQKLVGQPVQLERTPSTIARAAPRRGEHSEEILLELGLRRGPRPHESRRSLLMAEPVYQSSTERVQTWLDGRTLHIRFNNPARHNALSVDMWEAVPPLLDLARGRRPRAPGRVLRRGREGLRLRRRHHAVRGHARGARGRRLLREDGRDDADGHLRLPQADAGLHPRLLHRRRRQRGDQLRHPHRRHRFGVLHPAARLGLGYRYSAMKNLVDLIGPGAAKDLFFTARRIDAAEAKALGLVSRMARRKRWTRCWPNTPARSPRTRR